MGIKKMIADERRRESLCHNGVMILSSFLGLSFGVTPLISESL